MNILLLKFKQLISRVIFKSSIIIYLGKIGASIVVISNNSIIEDMFLTYDTDGVHKFNKFQELLSRYAGYNVSILIDLPEIKLQQEFLIAIETGIKKNPVDNYIKQHFGSNSIIGYYILNITYNGSELWQAQIASIELNHIIKTFVDEIIVRSEITFSGLFLCPLEIPKIIHTLLKSNIKTICNIMQHIANSTVFQITKTQYIPVQQTNYLTTKTKLFKKAYENNIILIVCITKANGITFCLFNQQNIIFSNTIPYCATKSPEYIYGILKYESNEILSSFKLYILESNKKVIIHYLVDEQIQNFIESDSNSYTDTIITTIPNTYSDQLISQLFNYCSIRCAYNKYLDEFNKLRKFNSVFLRFVLIAVIILCSILIRLWYKVFIQKKALANFYEQINTISANQRKAELELAASYNISSDIIESYYLDKHINSKHYPIALDALKLLLHDPNIEIQKITYTLNEQLPRNELLMSIEVKFYYLNNTTVNREDCLIQLEKYNANIIETFKNYEVNLTSLGQEICSHSNVSRKLLTMSISRIVN
ncbi:hypothetical protein ACA350_03865 [Orientia tsutsugamushi]|uniref:hypothetical protein n=1 Tax=Orientia tsutsugamushi TaxID=784 RepID=UPI0035295817